MGKQFTSEYQPKKNGRHKGSTASDWLRKLSHTRIKFHNPLTNKDEIGEVNLVVAIQLILKATQDSDLPSIREYFDRLDGKIPQKLMGEGFGDKIIIVNNGSVKREEFINRIKNQPQGNGDSIVDRTTKETT